MLLHKIKRNAIIMVCLIIICAFLFLSIFNYNLSKNDIHNEIVNSSIPLLRDNIFSEIEKSFLPAVGVASVMAHDSFLINWAINNEGDTSKITQYLNYMKIKFNYASTFFISNKSLNYYHYKDLFKKISETDSHDKWYFDFINSGLEYDLDVDYDEVKDNKLTIFINFRVNDFNGNLIGVTGVGIEMDNFSIFLEAQQKKYNRIIYLVDDEGVVQAHSDKNIIEKYNLTESFKDYDIKNSLLVKNQNSPVLTLKKHNGSNLLIASKYLKDINWFLIVEQNEDNALKVTNQNFIRTITVGLILLLTILILIIIVLNFFSSKLEQLAVTDPLTGCYNRREFNRVLNRSIKRRERFSTPLSLIAIDVDNFKSINDSYGHQFGDIVLQTLIELINLTKRPSDIVSRLGGDEFVIILEGNVNNALNLGNRIQKELNNIVLNSNNTEVKITLSIGIYELNDNDNEELALKKCDEKLYEAKKSGRDNIKV